MYIKRHIERLIKEDAEAFPAVLLTGPRQVGKSTTLREIMGDKKYILLDNTAMLRALKEDPEGFLELQGAPLILDEIQKAPEAFSGLKYRIDSERRPGMYFLTGSQRYELMQNVSESLAGRIGIINMLGLSAREISGDAFDEPFLPEATYFKRHGQVKHVGAGELWKRIHRGSMPELHANPKMNWDRYYASYVSSYVERDVRALAQVGDTLAFVQFMTALASRTGELLNISAVAKDIGKDSKTVKKWLSALEASGLIYLLRPFSLNVNKRLVKTPKVYFTDTGLVCHLCRWLTPETLANGAMAGQIFETFAVTEILKSYYNRGLEPDMYFFRNTDGQEIDLLFYANGSLYPLEIKKTSNPNKKDIRHFKALGNFFPSLSVKEGGVLCTCEALLPLEGDKYIIPLEMI